jgi:hypothetical protein
VARGEVRAERLAQSLELCARINDGLAFGCAEYSFDDRVVLLRDSLPFTGNDLDGRLSRASARLLQLGAHYAPAIRATLDGTSATEAGE